MIPHADLAKSCVALYADPTPASIDGIEYSVAGNVITLRGTADMDDFLRDFEALPLWYPQLGFVHSGFALGMADVFAKVRDVANPVITGHSLGGAHARLLAALFIVNGVIPAQLVTFAAPKPGNVNLARVLQKAGMEDVNYRNRNDIVPCVPGLLPPASWFWVHSVPFTELSVAPPVDDFGALRDHNMLLYAEGVSGTH